jgi:succinyl-CoA synthetase beta subunit
MRLLEFQAKRILREHGIAVPRSVLITSSENLEGVSFPAVFKAQIPVGGRGKAGGVRVVEKTAEAASIVEELLTSTIKGHPVQALLAEESVEVRRELYIAYLIDKKANLPMLMGSSAGGVDIEEVAKKTPEQIVKKYVDPTLGIQDFVIRSLAKALEIREIHGFRSLIQQICTIFQERDATLVEINPLAVTPDGFIAIDAKILLDDKAAYRQRNLFNDLQAEQRRLDRPSRIRSEELAEERSVTYVPLEGDIGMIADGAGTGMLTLDLIHEAGGRAANFCEMGGLANAEIMRQTMEVVLANTQVKVLLISLIGGLTRMDEMADGIVQYIRKTNRQFPMAVRMCGTKADVGKERLREAGIEAFEDLQETVRVAVERVKES